MRGWHRRVSCELTGRPLPAGVEYLRKRSVRHLLGTAATVLDDEFLVRETIAVKCKAFAIAFYVDT